MVVYIIVLLKKVLYIYHNFKIITPCYCSIHNQIWNWKNEIECLKMCGVHTSHFKKLLNFDGETGGKLK